MKLNFIHTRKNAGTSVIDFLNRAGVDYCISYYNFGEFEDYVSFAVKRNPYSRCISSWKYCSSTKNRDLLDCLNNPPQLEDVCEDRPDLLSGHDYRHFTQTQSQTIFNNGVGPTHILSFEHLDRDLEQMCLMYKIPFVTLNKLNVSKYDYKLDNNEREKIYQFFEEDFYNLGYIK